MKPRQKVQVHLWREGAGGERLYAVFHRCAAKGDYWQPITGNVDAGETAKVCALREAGEEAGLEARAEDLTPRVWVHDWSRDGEVFEEHVFGLRARTSELAISGEHRSYEWVSYAEALKRMAFEGNRRGLAWVEEYLRR